MGGPTTWNVESMGATVTAELLLDVQGNDGGVRGTPHLPADIWHDLVHEVATVRALTAAALLAVNQADSRRLLGLIELELTEVAAMLRQARRDGVTDDGGAVDVSSVVQDVVQQIAPTTTADVTIREVPVGPVGIDRLSLRRIVRNLVGNAVEAGAGRVEVRVGPTATGVEIEVADSGPGFGDQPVAPESLGLSIVAELAAAAGGATDLGTSDLGGAGITVTLPRSHAR
jgi:signal transduction histidine kinase